ncbi:hypothetical protein KUTeg_003352 [Tegillarca granosa]|uniref:HMG box domain-containing protein n=1 Tax=Tegillarca granosa TaxID=220873 RepID=A0ABQ9FLU9_TEGGR|nr:hypothetical protein KUTeg_003352 [Tegillarca granosa]
MLVHKPITKYWYQNHKDGPDFHIHSGICAVRYLSTSSSKDGFPEPPKKPVTTFLQFFISKKSEIQSQNPDKQYKEYARIASKMWNELDEKEKQKYQKAYDAKKTKYNQDYHEYLSNLTEDQKKQLQDDRTKTKEERQEKLALRKFRKRTVELGKPKKAISGYTMFARDFIKEKKTSEGLKIYKYNKLASEQREQYQENKSHWIQQMVLDGNNDVVKRNELKQELVNLGQPKRPPNAYALFSIELAKDRVGKPVSEIQKEIGEKWRKLPKDERQNFQEEYLSKLQGYKQAFEDWELQMEQDGMLQFVKAAQKLLEPKRRLAVVKPKKVASKKASKIQKTEKRTTKRSKDKKEVKAAEKKVTKTKKSTDKEKAAETKSEKTETKEKASKTKSEKKETKEKAAKTKSEKTETKEKAAKTKSGETETIEKKDDKPPTKKEWYEL